MRFYCLQSLFMSMIFFVCWFTSQVNSYGHGWTVSSPKHTFSWAGLNKRLTSNSSHTFAWNWQQPFLNESAEEWRMTIEIISWSISTKVWDQAGINLGITGSAVRCASVARHVTHCATLPSVYVNENLRCCKGRRHDVTCSRLMCYAMCGYNIIYDMTLSTKYQ